MAKLLERIKPTVFFCRLFGLGFQCEDSTMALLEYWLLFVFNLAYSCYSVFNDIFFIRYTLDRLMDIMSLLTIIRFYTRSVVPLIAICSIFFARNVIAKTMRTLDDLIPSVEQSPLSFYSRYFYGWISLSVAIEYLHFFTFWISANFEIYTYHDICNLMFFNVWASMPLAQFAVLILMIQNGIRQINDDITSIKKWKSYRTRWKKLKNLAEYLANDVFGLFIIVYVIYNMGEVFFFAFVSTKEPRKYLSYVFMITAFNRARLVAQLFHICQNCKKEVIKIQGILVNVKPNDRSDIKAIQFATLYMLHTDFKLMPYDIFELSFRQLLSIFTVVFVFLLFQIQMKLFDENNN